MSAKPHKTLDKCALCMSRELLSVLLSILQSSEVKSRLLHGSASSIRPYKCTLDAYICGPSSSSSSRVSILVERLGDFKGYLSKHGKCAVSLIAHGSNAIGLSCCACTTV